MPLEECRRRITPREFRLWQGWFRYQWEQPSLTQIYLARIAMELQGIAYVLLKKNKRLRLEDFIFRFDKERTLDPEQAAQWAKARWFGVTGYGKRR